MKILSDHMDKVKDLKEVILQPQSDLHLVRGFLEENGLQIVQEDMVEEACKYYPCMKAVFCGEKRDSYTEVEQWYGPLLLKQKHPVLYDYLQREKKTFEQIKTEIQQNAKNVDTGETKKDTIQNRLGQIAMALAYFEKQEV